jgi:cytochrome P450
VSRPPGPTAWPLVGHLPPYLRDKLGFLTQCVERYGDVVRLHMGEPTYLLNDPTDIQHVLVDNGGNYNKTWRLTSERGKRLSGSGMHTSFGVQHLRQRRMLQPAFSRASVGAFVDVMVERTKRRMAAWESVLQREGSCEVNLAAETESLALSILLGSLFGIPFDDERLAAHITARRRYIEYFYASLVPFAEHLPLGVVRDYRRAQRAIDQVIQQEVEHPSSSGSFVAMFAAATYPDGMRMNFEQLRDEILTQMSAGYETMGDALCWTLYLLANHPDGEAAVLREVCDVLGDREPTLEDIAKLSYTRQALEESMRLYPPTWIFVRMAVGEDTLPSGVPIRRGTKLYLCPWVTQRSAKHFPDPLRFDPEHFRPEEVAKRPRFTYFPFGGGQRQCIGEHFARLEGVTVLAMLLRRYRFEPDANQRIELWPGITLRPKHGMRVRIVKRHSNS